jgi:hypothetical protein
MCKGQPQCRPRAPQRLVLEVVGACAAGLLYGKINWRVPKADGDFLQRGVVQTFRQQDEKDVLLNHGSACFLPFLGWHGKFPRGTCRMARQVWCRPSGGQKGRVLLLSHGSASCAAGAMR